MLQVHGLSELRAEGGDTTILTCPREFLAKLDDGPEAVLVIQLGRFLRDLSNQQARDLDSIIHHAEFRVTNSIATIEQYGIFEGHEECLDCQRGVLVAVEYLKNHPEQVFIVGQLHWAVPPGE